MIQEDRGQRTEGRGQRAEDRGQMEKRDTYQQSLLVQEP